MKRLFATISLLACFLLGLPAQAASVESLEVEAPKNSNGLTLDLKWVNASGGPEAIGLQVSSNSSA